MVPSISMSYFDPRTGNYVKKSAPELKVQVREGAAPGAGSTPLEQAADKSGSAAKSKASSSAFGLALEWREPKHESDLWPLWVAAYCLVAIFLILAARQMGLLGRVDLQKRLQRELKARFKDLKASAQKGDWRQVGARGTNLLYFVLGQLSEQGGAQFEINQMLEKIPPSLRLEMKDQVEALLRELEILSFAPESYSASKRSKEHLVDVAHQLEKLLGRAISIFSGEASGSGRNKA